MMRSSGSTYNAKRKGKEVYEENNNTMDFAEFYAQRGNKGITICERSVNSRSEEMTQFLGTSNDHSSGQKLQSQDMTSMNQVSPNYFLSNSIKEMSVWPRHHKPRIIVHPSTILGSSRFSQNYDQNMQRTSVSAPYNFSLMKLLMEEENISTLTDEELLYAKELLSTDQGLSLEGQGVQQSLCSQVGNYQNMQRTPESATSNFSYMKLLMEDEKSSILTNELYEKQFLSSQYSLPSEGQMVQQWPCSQVGNYPFDNASEGQMVQQWPCSQVGNYPFDNASEGQMVQQWPCSQVGNYQFENSSEGQMVQQWPCSQVGNYQFENSLQQINLQNCQNQVLQQPQQTSYMDPLKRDDISYMDMLTRDDISCVDLLTREDISYMDLLTREDIYGL